MTVDVQAYRDAADSLKRLARAAQHCDDTIRDVSFTDDLAERVERYLRTLANGASRADLLAAFPMLTEARWLAVRRALLESGACDEVGGGPSRRYVVVGVHHV